MDRLKLGPDLKTSRLVYGLWRLADDPDTSPSHVRRKIEACLEQGVTTMDHADIYGGYTGEEIFGKALRAAPALRDRLEIVTKCGIVVPKGRHAAARLKHYDTSGAHIRASVDASLELMGIERIDLLLIHRPDPFMAPWETGAALDELVAAGKVRAVGVSNFRPHDLSLLQSAMNAPLVTNQIELSLLATEPFTNGDLAALMERRIHPMAWSPLAGGRLVAGEGGPLSGVLSRIAAEKGVEPAAVAVAWLLAHPAGILPILGTNSLPRIRTMGEALRVSLSRQDWFELYAAATGTPVP